MLIEGLSTLGVEEFTEELCDPDEIIIFDEQGNEFDIGRFVADLANEYENVKEDF